MRKFNVSTLLALLLLVSIATASPFSRLRDLLTFNTATDIQDSVSCVRPASFYAEYNAKAVGDKNVPWPPSGSEIILEDSQVCNEGETYLAILQSQATDPWTLLAKQLITANLNFLNGALVEESTAVLWQQAWHMMSICCDMASVSCHAEEFAAWTQLFTDVNEGRGGVPACAAPADILVVPDVCTGPTTECSEGCVWTCTYDEVKGICDCQCVCPPAPSFECPGACVVCVNQQCVCNEVPIVTPPDVTVPPPIPVEQPCTCNRPCAAGQVCTCQRIDGCCVCECTGGDAVPVDVMKCNTTCPFGCALRMSVVGNETVCQCLCPPTPDCIANATCTDNETATCYVIDDICICVCLPPVPEVCPVTLACPAGCRKEGIMLNGTCMESCMCEGCVRDASYWAASNRYTGMPWPSDGTMDVPLENRRFCPNGPTWLEILKVFTHDPAILLAKQYITAQLNVLSGASISAELLAKWTEAGNALSNCCDVVQCDRCNAICNGTVVETVTSNYTVCNNDTQACVNCNLTACERCDNPVPPPDVDCALCNAEACHKCMSSECLACECGHPMMVHPNDTDWVHPPMNDTDMDDGYDHGDYDDYYDHHPHPPMNDTGMNDTVPDVPMTNDTVPDVPNVPDVADNDTCVECCAACDACDFSACEFCLNRTIPDAINRQRDDCLACNRTACRLCNQVACESVTVVDQKHVCFAPVGCGRYCSATSCTYERCHVPCDSARLRQIEAELRDYNEGRAGLSKCPVACPIKIECPAECVPICEVVNGVCNCYCQCPPPPDCKCDVSCPPECTCVTWVDANGVCQSSCQCPPPADVPCACAVVCPVGCECRTWVDQAGICRSCCVCPPPPVCVCDLTCPAGCQPVCRIEDGKCVKLCVCPPPPDCRCQIECPVGCECVTFVDDKGVCQSFCNCPPPPDCICAIQCGPDCDCVCHRDELGECVCECRCPPCPPEPPVCECDIVCPENCICISVMTSCGHCESECQCPPPPDCECDIVCDGEDCECVTWVDANGKCQSRCDCQPPPDEPCECNIVCGEGCECKCCMHEDGCKCYCECPGSDEEWVHPDPVEPDVPEVPEVPDVPENETMPENDTYAEMR